MSLEGKVEAANHIVPAIIDALAQDRVASTRVRFGLIEFSDDARILLPLRGVAGPTVTAPALTVRAGTSFRSAFTLLQEAVPADVARLETNHRVVHRPTVFFLTDGEPTDDDKAWRSAFASLVARRAPSIVPCGVGQATVRVMSTLVHPRRGPHGGTLYMMDPAYPPAQAVNAFGAVVVSSMRASSRRSDGRTVLPTENGVPSGLTWHRVEDRQRTMARNGRWRVGQERRPGTMCQSGPAGSPSGAAPGTMGSWRTEASSGGNLNSLIYSVY